MSPVGGENLRWFFFHPNLGLSNPPGNFLQTSAWKISQILILGWNELHEG